MLQGVYFGCTALWPVLHIHSFMLVTGFKTDIWLVKSVSVLLLGLSVLILSTAFNGRSVSLSVIAAIIISSGGLAMVEFIYYFNGTLRWVYLADAILEVLFVLWWSAVFVRIRKNRTGYQREEERFTP